MDNTKSSTESANFDSQENPNDNPTDSTSPEPTTGENPRVETVPEETPPEETPTEEATEPTEPTKLGNIEYWDIVKPEIINMLNSHNLYIDYIDNGYPCVNFHVEYGIKNEEGNAIASGISPEEYQNLVASVKKDLHAILDKYQIDKPKTIFHACNSTLGIFFNNWYYDEHRTPYKVISLDVASYQIDLLDYYYEKEDSYILREGFF